MPSGATRSIVQLALLALLVALTVLASYGGQARANPIGGLAQVSAGGLHTCALTIEGGAVCWGSNTLGALGSPGQSCNNGNLACSPIPVGVNGLSSAVASVAAGDAHSCAVTTAPEAGGVKCWGVNAQGQLGDGGACGFACDTPVDVVGLASGAAAVNLGLRHTCALTTAGGIKCWGNGSIGELGDGTRTGSTIPTDVCATGAAAPCGAALLSDMAAVAVGYNHSCALTSSATVKCWGLNSQGQLGASTQEQCSLTSCSTTPVDVIGLTDVTALALGDRHACALSQLGAVRCWGGNTNGQLGDGSTQDSTTPVDVAGLASGVAAIAAHGDRTCVILDPGGVQCWGLSHGLVPVDLQLPNLSVAALAMGGGHICALTTAGAAKCWGSNSSGQLGDGTTNFSPTPVDVVLSGSKPTPAPTPIPVGGVAELPDTAKSQPPKHESALTSPRALLPLSLAAIAGAIVLATAAWYAKTRRVR